MAVREFFVCSALSSLLLLSLCVQPNAGNPILETVSINALLPSPNYNIQKASIKAKRKSSFEILHHSTLLTTKAHHAALAKDSLRVASIQKKIRAKTGNPYPDPDPRPSVRHKTALNIGASNYAITVSFGTPPAKQRVLFDTGSDISWIQCKPCLMTCYPQNETLFDPTLSSTYRNISCDSSACYAPHLRSCFEGNCRYRITYGDGSYSVGSLASDTLIMASGDTFDNFIFGCGEMNQGLVNGYGGLVGLSRSTYSLNAQLASSYGNMFAYCVPSKGVETGYLRIGNPLNTPTGYTPMVTDPRAPSLYFVNLTGITVGGRKLDVSPSAFQSVGTIIDVGTEITRLPPDAYSALKKVFRSMMTNYPLAAAFGVMDTCYDLTGHDRVTYPVTTFKYEGLELTLPPFGVLYFVNSRLACLAFAKSPDASDVVTLGSVQHRTMEVTYDNVGNRIGFFAGACS